MLVSAYHFDQDCVTGIDVAPLPSASEYDCPNALLYTAEQASFLAPAEKLHVWILWKYGSSMIWLKYAQIV